MADTENTTAGAANPAEAPKAESAVGVKSDSKDTTVDAKPEEKASEDRTSKGNTDVAGEQKWELNGKSEERNDRNERRGDRRNDRNGRSDRNNDRRDGHGGRGRGRGRGGFQNKRKNEEFDNLPESDDPTEIRAQVEFYFSTHNLVTDRHLFLELDGPKNKPVSIKHINNFRRMRRFVPYTAVVNALRESKDLVVVDDGEYSKPGNEAVKRKDALTVPTKDDDDEKKPDTLALFYRLKEASSNRLETSVYVKDFGEEDVGQITLEEFFRPYGSVMVRKRREENNAWKGSVFVEFDTEDSRKQFLDLDPKPKFNDNELFIMGKKEYSEMKCNEKNVKPDWEMTEQEKYEARQKRREQNGENHHSNGDRGGDRGRGGGRGRGRGGRGGRGGSDRRDNGRNNRDRNRSRSPRRRRDRSASGGSVDSRDWNTRRDRFSKGKDDRGSRKEEKKEIEKDAHGVPVVKDTSVEASNKRKANDEDREGSPKKSKLEIKQDE